MRLAVLPALVRSSEDPERCWQCAGAQREGVRGSSLLCPPSLLGHFSSIPIVS